MEGFQGLGVHTLHLARHPHHRCSWHLWAYCPFLLVFPSSALHTSLCSGGTNICTVAQSRSLGSHPGFPFLHDPHQITRSCELYLLKRSHMQTPLSPPRLCLLSSHLISCQDFYISHPTDLPDSRGNPSKTIFELYSE